MSYIIRCTFISILISFSIVSNLIADEGMWVPLFLNQNCYDRMKERGCMLSADDIYSINHASIKDAVVLFDRNCTGVIVSDRGLLLTNHHCGSKSLKNHSNVDNDYLNKGFWAMSQKEELPNPGLTVSLLLRMENVTAEILQGISDTTPELKRNLILLKNLESLEKSETLKSHGHKIEVKPLYNGNQFFLYEYEVFMDVRLVAAPPSGIGKFGAESDNWIWPRHTGDFSVFRIYADKNNDPAPYSPENIPYKPKKFITISLKGIKENDFTLVYGYPASGQPFLTSIETEYLVKTEIPQLINLRTKRLAIMGKMMKADKVTSNEYSQKYYGLSASWKKWQGELRGLYNSDAVRVKKQQEADFVKWINSNDSLKRKYGRVLDDFSKIFPKYAFYSLVNSYLAETFKSVELLDMAGKFNNFIRSASWSDTAKLRSEIVNYSNGLRYFYKTYNRTIDEETFSTLMQSYYLNIDQRFKPAIFDEVDKKYKGDFNRWAQNIYMKSLFTGKDKLWFYLDHMTEKNAAEILKDPAIIIYQSFGKVFKEKVLEPFTRLTVIKDSLTRMYTAALMTKNKDKLLYPEANQTLRVSFGKVEGYNVADAVDYLYYTTLDGIIEKDDSVSLDYHVPLKLKELYLAKDYGRYADKDGKIKVCFIATNQTSGGSSGSPVINGNGELIGLNFDRNWEGTSNEVLYDENQCRNISVDIRYVLFIIDKFAGAGYLLNEMEIR